MATKNPTAAQNNQDSGKRPYALTNDTYVQKMGRATDRSMEFMKRAYREFLAHSEFKKPYLSPTYDDMETGYYPSPEPKPWPWPQPHPVPPGPGPSPGPTPGPKPGPIVYPPEPGWKCSGCWGVGPIMEFCRNGPPVTATLMMVCPDDPPVSAEVSIGGGSVAVKGQTVIYTPGEDDVAFIHIHTRSGAVCFAFASAKNPDDCKKPDCSGISIGYTTTGMHINDTQQLSVVGGKTGCNCTWSVLSGGGSITSLGLYTAPASNANCANNPIIALTCNGVVVATLAIAVNGYASGTPAMQQRLLCTLSTPNCCTNGSDLGYVYLSRLVKYNCDGSVLSDTGCVSFTLTGSCTYDPGHPCTTGAVRDDLSLVDTRTSGMKAGGCCPAALL